MLSIIITTYKEPKTLSQAIKSILDEKISDDYEILVVGPDKETEKIVRDFSKSYPQVKYIKDQGRGKPAALNLAFQQALGEILVLTDGDVRIKKGAIEKLLKHFQNPKIGAVSGHPVPINPRSQIFGCWSYFLTKAAHQLRLKNQKFPCSGYLYAIQNIIKNIPKNALSEDAYISEMIYQNGYQIIYEPEAIVYVKYPDNFKDWLKQKIRSTGGYRQKFSIFNFQFSIKMRSFRQEILDGIKLFFTYPKSLKEFYWTFLLYLARVYLWLLIFWQIKIKKRPFKKVWQRVESTK